MTKLMDELIDLYEPITRACSRLHRLSEDKIKDIMHDTFLSAYQNIPKYREQAKMSSWLWIIAQRKVVDQLRKQSVHKRKKVFDTFQSFISLQNPTTLAESRELYQKLHESIAALPHAWRTAVELYYWHHKNTYEIAMHMQTDPGTVGVILHRSRRHLRRELEEIYSI
jgi:RNA polymerase sigma-70 factor (ECF subfamily)